MSRRPRSITASKTLPGWATATTDGKEKAFIQVGLSMLTDKRFQSLSGGARCTYLCMVSEAKGKRDFVFPRATAEKKYGIPPTSLKRHVKDLCDNGFVELSSSGRATREPNFYRFSFEWKRR